MKITLTPKELIAFEDKVIEHFENKKILAPVHLDNGNENQLIDIFTRYVNEDDWCCGTWRQHYKLLLKGVPQDELMSAILEGKSIGLCIEKHKIISSAIVGGILPIAIGIAMGIKRNGHSNKVVVFGGDMTFETGIAYECIKYATNWDLPILFVIENNYKSVCTPTKEVWNLNRCTYSPDIYEPGSVVEINKKIVYYEYTSKYPHAGGLKRIQF